MPHLISYNVIKSLRKMMPPMSKHLIKVICHRHQKIKHSKHQSQEHQDLGKIIKI